MIIKLDIWAAIFSTANQLVGEGSVDAKQVVTDSGVGAVFGGLAAVFKNAATNVGKNITTEAQQKYSSKAVRSSVEKEVKKELKMSGINTSGKSGSRMVKRDVASDVAAHKVSISIYNKDE